MRTRNLNFRQLITAELWFRCLALFKKVEMKVQCGQKLKLNTHQRFFIKKAKAQLPWESSYPSLPYICMSTREDRLNIHHLACSQFSSSTFDVMHQYCSPKGSYTKRNSVVKSVKHVCFVLALQAFGESQIRMFSIFSDRYSKHSSF